jgi:hypothetical protein
MNQKETEDVTLPTDTGAAEKMRDGQRAGGGDNNTDSDGGDPSSDEERVVDSGRLLESGAVLHAMSADEGEGDGTDEEMGERDLTPKEAAAATVVLDAPDDEHDQEGLALTGGDWFNTIKTLLKTTRKPKKNLPPV